MPWLSPGEPEGRGRPGWGSRGCCDQGGWREPAGSQGDPGCVQGWGLSSGPSVSVDGTQEITALSSLGMQRVRVGRGQWLVTRKWGERAVPWRARPPCPFPPSPALQPGPGFPPPSSFPRLLAPSHPSSDLLRAVPSAPSPVAPRDPSLLHSTCPQAATCRCLSMVSLSTFRHRPQGSRGLLHSQCHQALPRPCT